MVTKNTSKNQADEFEKADAIIAEHADADMSADEIYELLVQNGISPTYAAGIAVDMRPPE